MMRMPFRCLRTMPEMDTILRILTLQTLLGPCGSVTVLGCRHALASRNSPIPQWYLTKLLPKVLLSCVSSELPEKAPARPMSDTVDNSSPSLIRFKNEYKELQEAMTFTTEDPNAHL